MVPNELVQSGDARRRTTDQNNNVEGVVSQTHAPARACRENAQKPGGSL